jgi:C4-dicarboxylate-specific signal transduction histidine kinase
LFAHGHEQLLPNPLPPAPDVDEARQALSRIVRDGSRANALVGRVRDLAKISTRRSDVAEINGAIRGAVERFRTEAAKNGVSVKTEFVETLAPVSGDRVELQQILLNLIINAIEAMSATSEGSLELLITKSKNESDDVLVAVRDSGPGIGPRRSRASLQGFPHDQTE